jgi:hypothetical protein
MDMTTGKMMEGEGVAEEDPDIWSRVRSVSSLICHKKIDS